MLIFMLTLGALALLLAGKSLTHLLQQIPARNEDFDALSLRASTTSV